MLGCKIKIFGVLWRWLNQCCRWCFRCKHYRRRCRIRAPCCNEIFHCRHCHNESTVITPSSYLSLSLSHSFRRTLDSLIIIHCLFGRIRWCSWPRKIGTSLIAKLFRGCVFLFEYLFVRCHLFFPFFFFVFVAVVGAFGIESECVFFCR